MTYGQIRFIKWTLFVATLASVGFVAFYLERGLSERQGAVTEDIDGPSSPTSRQVELEQLDSEGRTAWSLTAAESIGQTEAGQVFRDVVIRFEAQDDTPVVVTADDCTIRSNRSVHLEGNVVVVDDTSLRLEAEVLEFRRFPDRVWSTQPVRYSKTGFRGTSGSMSFTIKRGELHLNDGVAMTFSEDGDAPVDVTSRSATILRDRHWVQYVDEVLVRQSDRRLRANDLQLFLDENNQFVTQVEAVEAVDLRMRVAESEQALDDDAEGREAASALTSEPGTKQLVTERLQMEFQEGGELLSRVRALDGGKLFMRLPDDASEGFDKTLEGNLLAFEFTDEGELSQMRGRGGVELILSPRTEGAPQKIVRARRMESDFDPVTGDLVEARCSRSVTFEQGDVRASGDHGVFDARGSKLVLTESPRLWDPTASLLADRIDLNVDTGDVVGEGNVRSSAGVDDGGMSVFPRGDDASGGPVYFVSDGMTYERERDVARYTGAARAFQGENRIEAETIEVHQKAGELIAEKDVRTVFLQSAPGAEAKQPSPTHTRAERLVYRSADNLFEYRDDARMQSEKMTLTGGSIDVRLRGEGGGLAEITVVGDVEIETADGEASGDHAKYLPEDDSMTITGERAWLENAGKVTEGKQLTFFLTDDRILVDGQEQNRTKTTYSSKPRTR